MGTLEAFHQYPELIATASHIVAVQRKLDRLAEVKHDSWVQLIMSVKRLYAAGAVDMEALMELLDDMRRSYGPGYTKIWDAHMPEEVPYIKVRGDTASQRYYRALKQKNLPNGPTPDTWVGTLPLDPDEPAPMFGQSVVYVLFDASNVPAYVGSTEGFRARMKAHMREKPGLVRWLAYGCADRESAYLMEDRLLKQHKPYLNRKQGR